MMAPIMASTFNRLFLYAKAAEAEALENFTTEALAACIRDDDAPMARALRSVGVLPTDDVETRVVPHTQVAVAGAGVIDLILQTESGDRLGEVWIEVKVYAGQSGSQFPK